MTRQATESVSLTKDDTADLRKIWELHLKPLGIKYSRPNVIRWMIAKEKNGGNS